MNFFKRLFSFGKKPAKDLDKNEIDDLKDEKDEESIQKDSVKEEVKQTRSLLSFLFKDTLFEIIRAATTINAINPI